MPLQLPTQPISQAGILILTHADTDLLSLHHAAAELPDGFVPLRALSMSKIKSEEHMQALVAGPVREAKIVVARLLGGAASLPGFRLLAEAASRDGQVLVVVSGAGMPDPELTAASTVSPAVVHQTTAYLSAGGRENAGQLLHFLADELLLTGFGYEPPCECPQHGIYHPDLGRDATLDDWLARHDPRRPTVGLLFYRAHWMSGNLDFVNAFVQAIESRGGNALPVFTSSLKDLSTDAAAKPAANWPAAFEFFWRDNRVLVDGLIATMSFSMGDVKADGPTPAGWSVGALAALDVPVFQAITCGTARWQWEASAVA